MNFLKRELIILGVLIAPIVYILMVWNQLPEQLPIHWNLQGEADNYGSKLLFPIVSIAIYLLLLLVPKIDPRKKNYDIFSKTYFKLRLMILVFFGALHTLVIMDTLGYDVQMDRVIITGVLLLFIAMGNYMSNIRPNWFIGIRTPWTLENEEVWRKTHFFASILWFWVGFAVLVTSFVLPSNILFPVVFTVVILIALIPAVYSYFVYKRISPKED